MLDFAFCKLGQIFIFNSYEMILQYCLSIHAINFFTFPTFSNFKVRLINQQNGDCNDSGMLDARLLSSTSFPVQVKLKGSQRLLMKIKIIAFKSKQDETLIGEGVVSIDKNAIDNSIRVPIYDRKQGVQEVAICSVDLFVSGNPIDKNTSLVVDKSKSKIDDWRDHTEDAVFSQMSFTVQSQNQRIQVELAPKTDSLQKIQTIKNKQTLLKNKNKLEQSIYSQKSNFQMKPVTPNKLNHLKKIEYPIQPSSPLQNSAYLSQAPSKIKNPANKRNSSEQKRQNIKSSPKSMAQQKKKQYKNQQNKRIIFESNPSLINESKTEQENTIDAQQVRKKLKQQQKITKQLKRYLSKHKQRQKNYSAEFKVEKHKVRRTELKVEEISSYKSQGNYLKYFHSPKQGKKLTITNFKAHQLRDNQLKEEVNQQNVEIPINKLSLNFANNSKIATFDALGYRAYCIANYIKEYPVEINIPEIQESLKVKVELNNCGQFEGLIGVQEGEKMAVILKPKQKSNSVLSALKGDSYKLCFDIKRYTQPKRAKESLKIDRNDVSFRQPHQWNSPEGDIRKRIQSINVQPWGYGYSYLNVSGSNQTDFLLKIKEKRKAIQSQVKFKKADNIKNDLKEGKEGQKPKKTKRSQSQNHNLDTSKDQREQQPKKNEIFVNQPSKREKKSITNKGENQQEKHKEKQGESADDIKATKNELNQINSIRNGNRNNYKFKNEKQQKKATIKQMWEKLLIKKKVQQEQTSQKERSGFKDTKSPANLRTKKNKDFQTSHGEDSDDSPVKSKLYSMVPGATRIMTVNNKEKPQDQSSAPLRTITVEVNNISITQPLAIVSQQLGEMSGKFIKLQIKDRITYYTEIIFNGQFNSILWKLSGCIFNDLIGNEVLEVQIYKTVENRITMLGKTSIRISKLYFLRNNHIYNGKIIYQKILNGQFTLSFEVKENIPFEIIEEEEEESPFNQPSFLPKSNLENLSIRQSEDLKNPMKSKNSIRNRKPQYSEGKEEKSSDESMVFRNNDRQRLKDTLRRNFNSNSNRKKIRPVNNSLEVEAISELQQSNYMPEGLHAANKMHKN